MAVSSFAELLDHEGHELECVSYGRSGEDPQNVAVECVECGMVLFDFDSEPSD